MKIQWDLYCITDQASSHGRSDEEVAKGLLSGGASVLQYRAKKASARDQLGTAIRLRALTQSKGIPFIVNDRIDLAIACGADGVHLGQDDLPISAARLMVGHDLLVGISTHSMEQALRAEADGADYIGFGPVFPTNTKENNVPAVGVAALNEVLAHVRIPVVAIGGIKLGNLDSLSQARCVAVVTALTGAEDVAGSTRALKARWNELLHVHDQVREKADRDKKLQTAKKVSFL